MASPDIQLTELYFLNGGGSLGARMRAHDWAASPLGRPAGWPAALRTLVGVMLGANQPMFVAWGEQRLMLYNEHYAPLLGDKDRFALGAPFMEVWAEAADDLTPLFDQVWRGEAVHMDDITLFLDRGQGLAEAHFAFSYSPVRDDAGAVVGLFCPCTEITGRVLAERRFQDDRRRQLSLMKQMPGFVAVLTGPDHTVQYVNDAYVTLGGQREYIGKDMRAVFPELEGQDFFETLDRVFTTGAPFAARAAPLRLLGDQGRRYADLLYAPIRNDNGEVTGIFATGYDVTELVLAQQAVAASAAEFRAFAEAMPNHVWAATPNGRIDWFNQRAHEYGGSGGKDVDSLAWATLVHPEDLPQAQTRWADALASGRDYETEFRLRRADGSYRWHLARAIAITGRNGAGQKDGGDEGGSGGAIERWIGTNTDIHDQRAAQSALAELNHDLERTVAERTAERDRMWETSPDLLAVLDFDGMLKRVNPAWATVLGYGPAELIGHHVNDFVLPEDHADTVLASDMAASGGRPRLQNRYRHKDGTIRWLSWVAAPAGSMIYATGRDITRERERAAELVLAQEALRQSQKMEAVGQLTGGIAHDFNNMLAVVVGSLDLLDRRLGDEDARSKRYVGAAMDGARRAALLTQRLLAFSRQQPLQPVPVDPNKLVAGMSDLLRHSIGADVRLETVLTGGMWRTHADPNQLENVILNLAVNARDAMPEGGRLTIETQNAHLDARYAADHLGVPAGQYVLIAVSDTGSGMPADVIAKAFDPFFTTKEVGKGTGLGLSQVYGFVKQSGGHVKIYSECDEGTTIKIYLPRLIAEQDDGAAETGAERRKLSDGQEVVLVVDDEPAVRAFSVDALIELGYHVIVADSGEAALKLLAQHPEISLLFTDVIMPDMNGRKLADEARRRHPDLRVLFTTGYTRNAVVHNGVLDADVDLIGKPFTIDDLGQRVRDVLDAPQRKSG